MWLTPAYLVRIRWNAAVATASSVELGCWRPGGRECQFQLVTSAQFKFITYMGESSGTLLPVSRQDASGVPGSDTDKRGCLVQRHVLRQQAVQNLKSRLLFGSQSHIFLETLSIHHGPGTRGV